jgi:site-specific DNA recombinase
VLLLAADEGITMTRRRAANVLTRRMKQGIAEWYVLDMLEKSWGGFEIHTKQGWNVGQPPYGYVADSVPRPVPARRAEGKHKTRLIPDPTRAATVQRIYEMRISERLAYRAIAERLNTDLALNPPPAPTDPARALGRWSVSSVREILHNPKYTGHMVWNRRATKKGGKVNPVADWVLSPEPTHPAIITPEQYAAAAAVAGHRERSRSGHEPNTHPATKRSYVLRSYVTCAECDRRMFGKILHAKTYYACQPRDGRAPAGHPVSIIVPEAALLAALADFFNTRLLGPDRAELLVASTTDRDEDAVAEHATRLAALDRTIADISLRQERLLRQAETPDPDDGANDPFAAGLRRRYNDLDTERRTHENHRAQLLANPPKPGTAAVQGLLEHLPIATLNLEKMPPDVLRELCEEFRISIVYDREGRRARFTAEIEAEIIGHLNQLVTPHAQICRVPPAGFEPAPLPPEAGTPRALQFHEHTAASEIVSLSSPVAPLAGVRPTNRSTTPMLRPMRQGTTTLKGLTPRG